MNFVNRMSEETQFAILGLGLFGMSVAKVLTDNGYSVLGVDKNPTIVHEMAQHLTHVVEADFTDESVLEQLGISNFDVVIISVGSNFETSIVSTMMCKEKKVDFIISKASDLRHKKILEYAGADLVILPEKEMGEKLAYKFIFNDPIEPLSKSENYDIIEISPKEEWISGTLKELKLRQKEGINILGLIRDGEVTAVLDPNTEIRKDDRLIILKSL